MEEKKILGWGKYEFTLVVCFFVAWGVIFLDRVVMPFLAPVVMADLGLTEMQYALQNTLLVGFFAISAIFLTGFIEASGKRKLWLILLTIGSGIFSILGGLSQTAGQLIVTRALVGLMQGPVAPIVYAMLVRESSEQKVALNSGIVNTGVGIIAITIGPIVMTQIAAVTSWRMSFVVTGISSIVAGLILLKVLRESAFATSEEKKQSQLKTLIILCKYRNVFISFILGILCMAAYWTTMLYATRFFVAAGNPLTGAGFIVSGMGAMGIVMAIVVPKLSDYMGRRAALVFWFALCAAMPFVMFGAPTSAAAIVMYVLLGGVPGSAMPFFHAIIPGETLPAHLVGTANGLILGIAELVGGSLWPAALGTIAESQGLPTVILTAGIALILAAIISLFLKETKKGKRAEDKIQSK